MECRIDDRSLLVVLQTGLTAMIAMLPPMYAEVGLSSTRYSFSFKQVQPNVDANWHADLDLDLVISATLCQAIGVYRQ